MSKNSGPCSIPNCGKQSRSKGYCYGHYERLRAYGDPLGGGTASGAAVAFFRDVACNYVGDDCLIWPFSRDENGYGLIRPNGRTTRTHRLVCETVIGPPPTEQHEVAHNCGNGHLGCCAPNHLRWATSSENEQDKKIHRINPRCGIKLAISDVRAIKDAAADEGNVDLARRYGVSKSMIWKIRTGKKWASLRPA